MLIPEYTPQFKRDMKRLERKHLDMNPLKTVMRFVLDDTPEAQNELVRRYGLHTLKGRWKGSFECHVANAGDWLLVWMTGDGIAVFQRTGTHDDIFRN